MSLAAVDRQRNPVLALRALDSAVEFAKKRDDLAAQAEADVFRFEIFRDQSKAADARPALQRALERTLDARQKVRSRPAQARAERLLARILEHYGDVQGARRATQRAYDLSASDARQLTATVLDASRRALTRRDLPAAREAVQKAIEAGLADEDIVYAALWLKLLERQLDVTSDGTTEEAFATIDDASGWPAKLRAWGRGKLNDQELLKSARDRVQRTEAIFYTAMAKHAAGQSDVALPKLREVAHSDAIELVEVTIARDLLAQHKGPALDIELPKNLDLP
jgi:tetratricopeptide (TPR) repeat protein